MGDKVSVKFLFSKEARDAVDKINIKPMSVLSIDGSPSRGIAREAMQAFYSLTKVDKPMLLSQVNKDAEKDLHVLFDGKEGFVKLQDVMNIIDNYETFTVVTWKNQLTSLGRVISNEVVHGHIPNYKFINELCTKGVVGKLIDGYAKDLLNEKITMEQFKDILNKHEHLGFGITDMVSPGISYKMLMEDDEVFNKKKSELYDKYREGIENNDPSAMDKFIKEMVEFSKKHYKDDPMMELYDSGAGPKLDNDFRMLKIAIGNIPDPGTGKVAIVKNNLKEGVQVSDIEAVANLQIAGAYARAQDTALGGYMVFRLTALFQSAKGHNGDCGSTQYLTTTDTNKGDLLYRYIKNPNGKGDIFIDDNNVDQFVGKTVHKRSPIYCKGLKGGYCSHCMGETAFLMAKEDKVNIGLYVPLIGQTILNNYMKATHDMGAKLYKINDLDDFIVK